MHDLGIDGQFTGSTSLRPESNRARPKVPGNMQACSIIDGTATLAIVASVTRSEPAIEATNIASSNTPPARGQRRTRYANAIITTELPSKDPNTTPVWPPGTFVLLGSGEPVVWLFRQVCVRPIAIFVG